MPTRDRVALGKARRGSANSLLQWMTAVQIVFGLQRVHPAVREKSRVLARAVVMQRAPRRAYRRRRLGRGKITRRMAAALQRFFIEPHPRQNALHDRHVHRLTAVARAHQRQLMRPEAVMRKAAILDKRQRLQRLQRAACEVKRVRIAGRGHQLAMRIDDRDRAVMHALGGAATRGFDQGHVARDHRPNLTVRTTNSNVQRGCTCVV